MEKIFYSDYGKLKEERPISHNVWRVEVDSKLDTETVGKKHERRGLQLIRRKKSSFNSQKLGGMNTLQESMRVIHRWGNKISSRRHGQLVNRLEEETNSRDDIEFKWKGSFTEKIAEHHQNWQATWTPC